MRAVLTAVMLAALLLLGASAQQRPQPASEAAEELSIHRYGDRNQTCQEWTDGCRSCTRSAASDPICSNVGIACQPAAIRCARQAEPK